MLDNLYIWENMSEAQFEGFQNRLKLVEVLLDDGISLHDKREAKREYREKHQVSDRTIRCYVARYKKKGPKGLVFWYPKEKVSRIKDEDLAKKIIDLIHELPSRSIPQIRRILSHQDIYREKIAGISDRTVYRFLEENSLGYAARSRLMGENKRMSYISFEASHSMALVQGDARDGIWITDPEGKKIKTYLFLWIDDHSRKILFGKYYTNEKLPYMEDTFRYMVLRWGIPVKIYLDNGKVYISRHFAYILSELKIKKLHHPPYQAHCKGKIESDMGVIKRQFQDEAALCNMSTVEELNTAFWAWCDVYYNKKTHSRTGQAPDERFLSGLKPDHRRVTDLEWFNELYYWRENRTISRYGKIKLFKNEYPVTTVRYGTVIQVRFDPFDLHEVYLYDQNDHFLEKTQASKEVRSFIVVPEEIDKSKQKISKESIDYFQHLREQHLKSQKEINNIDFSMFTKKDKTEE